MSFREGTHRRGIRLTVGTVLLGALALAVIGLPGASALVGDTDLSLTKSDSADPVTKDSDFTYTIRVTNPGPNDASAVKVTDTLPSQVDYKSATPSSGTCSRAGSVVTCELGQVNSGVAATVTIVVTAKRSGTASNTATVTTTVMDANTANNADTETTLIQDAPATTKTKKGKGKKSKGCSAPTISGTAGNDSITGTTKNDVIVTFGGNDSVIAGDGKDIVCTGSGDDTVSGGPKNDTIIGGVGRDALFGNTGGDVLKGNKSRDKLRGNADDDFLGGGRARDNCRGGSGNDTLASCP